MKLSFGTDYSGGGGGIYGRLGWYDEADWDVGVAG